jgi:hypothetical protein
MRRFSTFLLFCVTPIGVVTAPPANAQSVTTEENATLESILAEIHSIDDELQAITENQVALRRSAAMRRDEYESLKARYPGIRITPTSSVEQLYAALYAFRRERAAVARPIAVRRKHEADTQLCAAIDALQKSFDELAASDGYKKLSLQDRLELRTSIDRLIVQSKENGVRCPATAAAP